MPVESAPEEPSTSASAALDTTAGNASFPEDEPIFATAVSEPLHEQHEHVLDEQTDEEVQSAVLSAAMGAIPELRNETRGDAEEYVAPLSIVPESARETISQAVPQTSERVERFEQDAVNGDLQVAAHNVSAHSAVEEHELIEEEEAELTSYGEEPGDDGGFEELEEETRAAGELPPSDVGNIAPVAGGEAAANGEARSGSAVLEAGRAGSGRVGTGKRRRRKPRRCSRPRRLAAERLMQARKFELRRRKRCCCSGRSGEGRNADSIAIVGGVVAVGVFAAARTPWCRRSANC